VGGIHTQGSGGVALKNTILAGNINGNADAALMSLGYNIDSDGTAGLAGPGDQSGVDPLLGALQFNGGTLKTHALPMGSPAIDAGTSAGAPLVDERGSVRDASPDVGAFEFNGVANAPPVAAADAYAVNEDGTLNVAAAGVLGNDLDADFDPLTAMLFAGPSNGSLTFNADGSFTYAPNANFNGLDAFSYRATDGTANSIPAVVTITVNAVNDPPAASDAMFTILGASPNGTPVGIVSASDPDVPSVLTYAIVGGNTGGAFAINAVTGALTVADSTQLDPQVNPTFVLTVQVDDGLGQSDTAAITVNVSSVGALVGGSLVGSTLVGSGLIDNVVPVPALIEVLDASELAPESAAPAMPAAAAQASLSALTDVPEFQGMHDAIATVYVDTGAAIPSLAPNAEILAPPGNRALDLPPPGNRDRLPIDENRLAAVDVQPAAPAPVSYAGSVTLLVQPGTLWHALDDLRGDLRELTQMRQVMVGTALTATGGLTVGYVLWMVRGGLLLSSLIAQLPAWKLVDPLTVLDSVQDEEDEDDESLETIVEGAGAGAAVVADGGEEAR
jgi:hypothetical protein